MKIGLVCIEVTSLHTLRANGYPVLIWSDAGTEMTSSHIPVPSTREFTVVSSELTFCPVFFENKLIEDSIQESSPSSPTKQPLALLTTNYGITVDWSNCKEISPLLALKEVLAFEASSGLQYLNMIEQVLSDYTTRGKFPSYEHTKLETILHFDYAKTILARSELHFIEVLAFLESPATRWTSKATAPSTEQEAQAISTLKIDFGYLISRVERLSAICEAGKATLMSNASVQESKRSAEESKLVTELTKATNRVTFIFLPISYVTAIFGMNFSQFGQGNLSIWLWAVVTFPLLIVSVMIVEYGAWIKSKFLRGQ